MKRFVQDRALPLAVLAYCVWSAGDLIVAWRHSPYDQLGSVSFLVWLAPAVWRGLRQGTASGNGTASPTLTALALVLVVAGRILEVNALLYLALALAIGALTPQLGRHGLWLAGAISWMPALGWLATGLPPAAVGVLRLLIAGVAGAVWFLPDRRLRTA